MFREALGYPTSGDQGIGAVLVGGGMLLLAAFFSVIGAFLYFPILIGFVFRVVLRGYYVRVMRWTTRHPDEPAPAFDDWNTLLVDGLQAAFISFLYWLPAIVLFVVAAVVGEITSVPDPNAAVAAAKSATGLVVLVGLMYLVAMFYVVPAAVTNFAYHDDFFAAFRLREIVSAVLTEDYAVGWVVTVVYQVVALPFVLLLYLLLLGFFLRAYVGIGVRHVYGLAARDAFDFDSMPVPDDEWDEEVATPEPSKEDLDVTDLVSSEDTRRPDGDGPSESVPSGGYARAGEVDPWRERSDPTSDAEPRDDADHGDDEDPDSREDGR